MNKVQDYINSANELAKDGSFVSKAAKKSAIDYLNRAYQEIRKVTREIQLKDMWADVHARGDERPSDSDWVAFDDTPYDLHQVREKHSGMYLDQWSTIQTLVAARNEFKSYEITPKVASAEALMAKEERNTNAAMKDDGFRVGGSISAQWQSCYSVLGNHFWRVMYYFNCRRTAYSEIAVYVRKCLEAWEKAGKPNMADWDSSKINEFYKAA